MWFDSHCHVQGHYASGDPVAVVERAAAAGVDRFVCVGTDAGESANALALVRALRSAPAGTQCWATLGVHPHEASQGTADLAELVREHAGAPEVVAIGECGLDYHYDHSPREAQRRAFAEQIAIAREHDLALVVHTREAWDDTFAILADAGVPERTVFHCFTGGPAELERCLAIGAWVSFSGIVTFKNATEVQESAKRCPPDRMLVETDAPFLAPVPVRGEPNEPARVTYVGECIARLRGEDAGELAARTTGNACRLFGVP